ncbi:hypothetical protein M2318_005415 [Metapseudomonas resinovorans]
MVTTLPELTKKTQIKSPESGEIRQSCCPSIPLKQMTFGVAEYASKRKQTRRELFRIEMDQVVPWKGLVALIEQYYPKGKGSVRPIR